MDKTIATVTAYARQYPFEADSTLSELSFAGTTANHNYIVDVLGHKVMITFEEDANGEWHKRVRIFGSPSQEVARKIIELVDGMMNPECVVYSRLMDPEE